MTSLHKNLKHLAAFYGVPKGQIEQCVGDIERAIADAKYVKIPDLVEDTWREYNKMAGYMTGQGWYDRFEKELWHPPEQVIGNDDESRSRFYRVGGQQFMHTRALKAARRAAGLE